MKNIAIVRKVPFKLAHNRLVWGMVLAESQGLALIFIKKTDEHGSHSLILAQEHVDGKFYEDAKANRFYLEHDDLAGLGDKLGALGVGLSREEFDKFFQPKDDWMEE